MARITVVALVAPLCLGAVPAVAGPIAVDEGRYGFCFGEAGSPARR